MKFYAGIAAIVAPVFLVTLAGFFWTRRGLSFDQTMVTDLVAKFSVPCLVFTALTQSNIALSTFFTFGTAAVACHALFAVVGMVALKARHLPVRVYFPAFSGCRCFASSGGAGIGWLVATAFGLSEAFRGVLIIQSFMPAAVFNYLFARLSDTQPEQVASMILLSTVQSYVLLPVLVAWVM